MTRLSHRVASAVAVAGLATFAAAGAGVAEPTEKPESFQDFKSQTYQDDDGQYIVDGDIPVSGTKDLRAFYERLFGPTNPDELIVNTVGGQDDVWSASQARNLTYCVSTKFGSSYNAVVQAMASGAAQWEGATSGVNYTHVSTQDGNCTTRNTNVVFSVEPTSTTSYIARAFFPSQSKSSRNVLVNASSLLNSGSWSPSNIMAHELGHTLGLRHEHTRPESGQCFEDNNWRPLSAYDSASIMHYPQCGGSSSTLSMSATDRAAIKTIYPG